MQTRYKIQNTHVAVNDSLSYCCHDDLSERKVVEALKLGANRIVSARQWWLIYYNQSQSQ